jgi:RecQ-mediated genome instability protein 1
MPPPAQVNLLLEKKYPKPKVDAVRSGTASRRGTRFCLYRVSSPRSQEWLDSCYDWVVSENNLDPARNMPEILKQVEEQLLGSDLSDSMESGTGLARNIPTALKGATGAVPILVQVVSITDIGQSAFHLQNVRQTRLDRADLAGLAEQDGGEDDGPVPKYPRSMLQFMLSDGNTTIKAIEFRKIPQLTLDETPLGYKVCTLVCMPL